MESLHKLADHFDLDDVLHFPINHSEKYVDPETGCPYTNCRRNVETFESRSLEFGFKPHELDSYLGSKMWHTYCKQCKLDKL